MGVVLDKNDKKILFELDINSRQSNSEIAKKVGLSKQVVGFRISRLLSNGIIHSFHSVIDISKLGFTVHKNFIRLQNINREKEIEFINYLKKNPNVVWCVSCDGRFDIAFGTWARNMEDLDRTLKEIDKKYGDHILERQIATIIRGEYFIRDYLVSKEKPSALRKSFFGSTTSQIDMDKSNWKILAELGESARKTSVEISKNIGISPDAVSDRIKKMENSGVLKHNNFVPNEKNYPYLHYKVLVGLKVSEEREKSLVEYCRINPNIVYIVKALGPWEFELDIEVENAEKMREIMMDIKTKFNDIIRDYSILNIYQIHKYNFCPSVQNN